MTAGAIEHANRNLKQYLGIQNPQSWVGDGPERVVALVRRRLAALRSATNLISALASAV